MSQNLDLYKWQLHQANPTDPACTIASFHSHSLQLLKRDFASIITKRLFDVYMRPQRTTFNLSCINAASSSAIPHGEALQFSFSQRGTKLLAWNSSRIYILNTLTQGIEVLREVKVVRKPKLAAISDDDDLLLVLSTLHQLDIYRMDFSPPKRLKSLTFDHAPRAIALSPAGAVVALAFEFGIEIHALHPPYDSSEKRVVKCDSIDHLIFSDDGTLIIGTTQNTPEPNTIILSAPYFEAGPEASLDTISQLWTTSIIFPSSSRDASHATPLPTSLPDHNRWILTYDRDTNIAKWVRRTYHETSTTRRLVVVAMGAPSPSLVTDDVQIPVKDAGRLHIYDFSISPTNGLEATHTIELGSDEPEELEEERRPLNEEVAIVRRRTIIQNRMSTTIQSDMAEDIEVNDPTMETPYGHSAPRSSDTLRRAATAAACSRQNPPRRSIVEQTEFHSNLGREEHPHDGELDDWLPPPPPYTPNAVSSLSQLTSERPGPDRQASPSSVSLRRSSSSSVSSTISSDTVVSDNSERRSLETFGIATEVTTAEASHTQHVSTSDDITNDGDAQTSSFSSPSVEQIARLQSRSKHPAVRRPKNASSGFNTVNVVPPITASVTQNSLHPNPPPVLPPRSLTAPLSRSSFQPIPPLPRSRGKERYEGMRTAPFFSTSEEDLMIVRGKASASTPDLPSSVTPAASKRPQARRLDTIYSVASIADLARKRSSVYGSSQLQSVVEGKRRFSPFGGLAKKKEHVDTSGNTNENAETMSKQSPRISDRTKCTVM